MITFFKLFFGLLLFGALVFITLSSADAFSSLSTLSWLNIISLGFLTFLYLILTAATFKVSVLLAGIRIRFHESLSLIAISNFLNYLAPARPGLIAKALYLKTEKNVSIATYSAISWTNALLMILVCGVLGIIAITASSLHRYDYALALYSIALGAGLFATLFLFLNIPQIPIRGRVSRFFNSIVAAVQTTRTNRELVVRLTLLLIVQYIAASAVIFVTYHALGLHLSMFNAIAVAAFSTLSSMLSITPNNLGVQELIIGLVSVTFGLDFTHGLLAGGLLRLVHVGVIVLVTPFALLLLSRIAVRSKINFF